jgi:GNAT superfamily N-acetyltransferase
VEIGKLDAKSDTTDFDCGEEPLNRFLQRYALQNQNASASRTYVLTDNGKIAGYHTLVVGEVTTENAPERLTKGLGRYPVPIMILARLAVDRCWQDKGIGAMLLKDALMRTLQAADIAGIRAFAVHAKNDRARAFYEHFDFIASPTDPLHLFVLLKDVRGLLR